MAVQTGGVEGAILPPDQVIVLKWSDLFEYALWDMPMGTGCTLLLMTREKWESFPPDIQLIMEQQSFKAKYQYVDHQFGTYPSFSDALSDVGLEVYSLDAAEQARWEAALNPIYDEWVAEMEAKGAPGEAALETAKQVLLRSR